MAVGALLRERLGDEVVDRLVEPLLGGVYAGRADELSLAATMPALAAELPAPARCSAAAAAARTPGCAAAVTPTARCSPPCGDGIGALPEALVAASRADVRLRTPAPAPADGDRLRAVDRARGGAGAADRRRRAGRRARRRRPPGCSASGAPAAVEPLQGIPYASMAVVAMAFPAQDVDAGSGLLVPPVAGRLVKGVTVSSAKWPHLAGEALLVRRLGRPLPRRGRAPAARRRPDRRGRRRRRGPAGPARPEPLETRLVRWGGGLPQYLVGHPDGWTRSAPRSARCPAWRSPAPRSGRRRPGLHPRRPPALRRGPGALPPLLQLSDRDGERVGGSQRKVPMHTPPLAPVEATPARRGGASRRRHAPGTAGMWACQAGS